VRDQAKPTLNRDSRFVQSLLIVAAHRLVLITSGFEAGLHCSARATSCEVLATSIVHACVGSRRGGRIGRREKSVAVGSAPRRVRTRIQKQLIVSDLHLLEQKLMFTYLSVGVVEVLIDWTCGDLLREVEQSIPGLLGTV